MSSKETEITVNTVAAMFGDFYSKRHPTIAILKLYAKLCTLFGIDRMSVIAHHGGQDKYLKMYEYILNKGFINHTKKLNVEMNQCINILDYQTDSARQKIKDLCGKQHYIHTTQFSDIQKDFQAVGFQASSDLKEIYIFLADCTDLFTYCTFERMDDTPLTDTEIAILTNACKMINKTIADMVINRKHLNEIAMRDAILDYEKIPTLLIDKDTSKIIHYNQHCQTIADDLKVNAVYEHTTGIEKELLVIDEDNQQWIRKAIPFRLANDKEAYMIYAKNTTDYINQLTAVDELTQSLCPKGFEEYYRSFVQRSNDTYALLSIDIDKFKYVNSLMGYEIGDKILKNIAEVICGFIDPQENFCRLGEDKFAVFLQYNTDDHLNRKLRKLFAMFKDMRQANFSDIKITMVGGLTLVDKSSPYNVLLDQSSIARKSAKGSIDNNFSYYNKELDLKLQQEIQIEEQIPRALANDEFIPYLQPKFDLNTRQICGAEALVRWITPNGMIYPDQFIPLFERNGFITTLDFIVYEKVMQYIRKCLDNDLPVYPISVNVSRNHMNDGDFMHKFIALINKYNVPHGYLELEITESVFVDDRIKLQNFVNGIKNYTLKVSIDDFGTAYSSLQTLTDIDVDILKIDKGFLDNISSSKNTNDAPSKDEILIKNIINLAKELDFHVICEGVETDEQLNLLQKAGCEFGQGYIFAKPMPIADYDKQFIST